MSTALSSCSTSCSLVRFDPRALYHAISLPSILTQFLFLKTDSAGVSFPHRKKTVPGGHPPPKERGNPLKKNRLLFLTLLLSLFCLASCAHQASVPAQPSATLADPVLTKFSGSFFDSFDTVTQLIGFTETEEEFNAVLEEARQFMLRYHKIYDGYNAYNGIHNLYEVNRNAAAGPTPAEPELIELITWSLEHQKEVPPTVNIAMGSVLSLWHEYREAGTSVPPLEQLQARNTHVDPEKVVIDREAGTVFFADPDLTLDLGAVAKGYTVEKMTVELLEKKMPHFVLSAGGNVRCGQKPLDGRSVWGVGIQNPGELKSGVSTDYIDVVYLKELSVVTSGDYQRFYTVDGVRYHHLIHPVTLMPGDFMRSVTVVTKDSGYADLLSTTLFLLPYEEGRTLVDSLPDVEAYWILQDGTCCYTDGLKAHLMSEGATAR